ncbi:LPS export ABC transporter periplasmic protein LptC [Candidatus Pelagibacter sp.]|nr:LPS export ABC transporter periplasmic protein LptC [Candidatus Pelagibacter sp.]
MKKKIITIFLVMLIFGVFYFIYPKYYKKEKVEEISIIKPEDISPNSNIIKDINYTSEDAKGNKYIINAVRGEIDYSDTNIIYLTDVEAVIKLNNSNNIKITSDFGKYNIDNFDTIFSENVISNYLDNKITGEYLDFSLKRNSMIVSRNVVYTNLENVLKADVVEMNLKTKDTKIFMYKNNEKVNIKNKY